MKEASQLSKVPGRSEGALMEAMEVMHIESRWQVALTVLVVFALLTLLPGHIRAFPNWVPLLLTIALIAPMVAIQFTTGKARWLRVERVVILFFFLITGVGLVKCLVYLLYEMVRRSYEVSGAQPLASSVAIWATNVLLFSLAYWRLDRGGPGARANHTSAKPDWLFPAYNVPQYVSPDWHPTFVDVESDYVHGDKDGLFFTHPEASCIGLEYPAKLEQFPFFARYVASVGYEEQHFDGAML